MRRLALLGLAPLGLVLFLAAPLPSGPAAAAPTACSKRTDVVSHLSKKFEEAPVAIGLASNGGLLEVLTTGTGSTWTIILTMPNGISCLVAAGHDWQMTAKAVAKDGPQI